MQVGSRKIDPKCWSPELVLTGAERLPGTISLLQVAEIIEGKRSVMERGIVFGQANIGALRWSVDPAQFLARPQADRAAVKSGDVVINKILPIRAAWVTSRLRRHPVDANCILIRGLDEAMSFWTAFCLNQALYKDYLAATAEGAVLPRLKIRALRELALMPAPDEWKPLSAKAATNLDELLSREESLRSQVASSEDRINPPEVLRFWEERISAIDNHSWWKRIPAEMIHDSLSPSHALFELLRQDLQANFGWVPIKNCVAVMPEQESKKYRQRLVVSDGQSMIARCLRISDIASDFTVAKPPEPEPVDWPGRVYQLPLQLDEVLVSLLVSSPKVAFAGHVPASDIHLTDHWERLVFRETPGAWAIVLNSSLVRIQLRLLAQGSARQFLSSGSLDQIVVPDLPREERLPLHRSLVEYQQNRIELEGAWGRLLSQAQRIYTISHQQAGSNLPAKTNWLQMEAGR